MNVQLKDVMAAVGPAAGLMFAAWLFLGFLTQRYVAAFERYRALVDDYRKDEQGEGSQRRESLARQIVLYRRRCDLMRWATAVGLMSAVLLVAVLIFGVLDVVLPKTAWIQIVGTGAAVLGLSCVIAASCIVLAENGALRHALDDEVRDLDGASPGNTDPREDATKRPHI